MAWRSPPAPWALLIRVGFSAEAVRREQALRLGAEADFRIGDLAATGLDAGSAGAVLCVDAIHFAPRPDAPTARSGESSRLAGARC